MSKGTEILILSAVRSYRGKSDYDDLLQEARIGLWKAERDYNPAKGTKFSSYAITRMRGEILHYLRDHVRLIAIPAYAQERGGEFPTAEFMSDIEGLV